MPLLPLSIASLAQRLGLADRALRRVRVGAGALHLPFQPIPGVPDSIWWQTNPPLQRLVDLPRDALSGPVQDDKAAARAVLMRLVEQERYDLDEIDLRRIDGLSGNDPQASAHASLESYSKTPECRHIRIISYRDFVKASSLALPALSGEGPLQLRQADWRGERLFLAGDQHPQALACAIVYARRRGLEVVRPAELTRYRLSPDGLAELRRRYHVLGMPVQAWSDPAFMGLLLDNRLPYARLALLNRADAPELLLLPRQHRAADALGTGLRQAGAADVVEAFARLQTADSSPERGRTGAPP